jgi:hypothetical protein
MSRDFQDWVGAEMTRLLGSSDTSFLEGVVTAMSDDRLIEETLADLTGDLAFAKEFMRFKAFDAESRARGHAKTPAKPAQQQQQPKGALSGSAFAALADDGFSAPVGGKKRGGKGKGRK